MKKTLISALVASITLVACGGDSDDSGAQDQVADLIIGAAEDAGASPDADCIRGKAQELADADAEAMVEAGLEGEPEISTAANEILAEILTC